MKNELSERLLGSGTLEWFAEELAVIDTLGDEPATWPTLKKFSLQVRVFIFPAMLVIAAFVSLENAVSGA